MSASVPPEQTPEPDLSHLQRKAGEQVSEDERWRSGLQDSAASPLLDWALELTDAALARVLRAAAAPASAGRGGSSTVDGDLPYVVADQARAILAALAGLWQGRAPADVAADLHAHTGAPLFESPPAAAATIQQGLARAGWNGTLPLSPADSPSLSPAGSSSHSPAGDASLSPTPAAGNPSSPGKSAGQATQSRKSATPQATGAAGAPGSRRGPDPKAHPRTDSTT